MSLRGPFAALHTDPAQHWHRGAREWAPPTSLLPLSWSHTALSKATSDLHWQPPGASPCPPPGHAFPSAAGTPGSPGFPPPPPPPAVTSPPLCSPLSILSPLVSLVAPSWMSPQEWGLADTSPLIFTSTCSFHRLPCLRKCQCRPVGGPALSHTPHLILGSPSKSSRHPHGFHASSSHQHQSPAVASLLLLLLPPTEGSLTQPESLFGSKPSMAATSLRGRAQVLPQPTRPCAICPWCLSVPTSTPPLTPPQTGQLSCHSRHTPLCSRFRAWHLPLPWARNVPLSGTISFHPFNPSGLGSDVTSSMRFSDQAIQSCIPTPGHIPQCFHPPQLLP